MPELLHLNVLSQKRRHIEVFAFDDSRLAFFKAAARHRLELQDFLFRLRRFFSRRFFLVCRKRFLRWPAYDGLRYARRGYCGRWRFGHRRLFKWSVFLGRRGFDDNFLSFDLHLWLNRPVLLPSCWPE